MKRITLLCCIGCLAFGSAGIAQPDTLYLNQTPPGKTITKFASGIISLPNNKDYYVSFAPSGTELFYGTSNSVKHSVYEDGAWQEFTPYTAPEGYKSPVFSPVDGLLYLWEGDNSLGFSVRNGGVWSPVTRINPDINEGYPTATKDSFVYYIYYVDWGIFSIKYDGINHSEPYRLPYPINDNPAFVPNDPCISPNHDYLVMLREGSGLCFVSFKNEKNQWTYPKRLDKYYLNPANVQSFGQRPKISPDGKYLFAADYTNTNMDIYWVSTDIIEDARNSNFDPYVHYYHKIPDTSAIINIPFEFTFSDSAFVDDDGTETLSITATLHDDSDLPEWLGFDPETRTFSGTATSAPEGGLFNIKVTATDDADASTTDFFFLTIIGPNEVPASPEMSLRLYPNPTEGILYLESSGIRTEGLPYEIFDMSGKLIVKGRIAGNSICLQGMRSGIYFLKVHCPGQILIQKVLIK
jgi:hypothetical protein